MITFKTYWNDTLVLKNNEILGYITTSAYLTLITKAGYIKIIKDSAEFNLKDFQILLINFIENYIDTDNSFSSTFEYSVKWEY